LRAMHLEARDHLARGDGRDRAVGAVSDDKSIVNGGLKVLDTEMTWDRRGRDRDVGAVSADKSILNGGLKSNVNGGLKVLENVSF